MFLKVLDLFIGMHFYTIIFLLNALLALVIVCKILCMGKEKQQKDELNNFLGDVTKTINSIRYGDLSKKIKNSDLPDAEHLTESLNRMIETLHDREIMIDEYKEELIKQNKMLESVINSLSDGLIITDFNGKIFRVTEHISEWFGIDEKKLVGQNIHNYIEVTDKRPISLWKDNDAMLLADRASNFTVSTVELNLSDTGNHYIIVIKNVTNQKELENLKDDFVATLTHDLKVPIIAETNMIELFLNESFGKINEKQKFALENMQASNKELLELVQTVLETYKTGKITLYKENIMLKSFITEIINEMTPIAEKTSNKINLILERDIRVFADKFQLSRVLKNLIQNALLYGSPNTPVNITIGEIPEYVTIKVKDFGAGISRDEIDKIFNKYYSAAKKFRKIGTGLGLYLSFQIIKAHNGDLSVESKEGEYTEFCIKIPV